MSRLLVVLIACLTWYGGLLRPLMAIAGTPDGGTLVFDSTTKWTPTAKIISVRDRGKEVCFKDARGWHAKDWRACAEQMWSSYMRLVKAVAPATAAARAMGER